MSGKEKVAWGKGGGKMCGMEGARGKGGGKMCGMEGARGKGGAMW